MGTREKRRSETRNRFHPDLLSETRRISTKETKERWRRKDPFSPLARRRKRRKRER